MNKFLVAAILCGLYASPALAAEPPMGMSPFQTASARSVVRKTNLIDTAVAAGHFKTLIAALKATGLSGVLKGKGPFTVFAPTDAAFAKLPKGTMANLLKAENHKKLVAILTYHTVAGKLLVADLSQHYLLGQSASAVKKNNSLKTIEGENVSITGDKIMVKVNGAQLSKNDILCTNGVIHPIDTVLMPPNKK
jgi:transforming growth factor-beta-induced protein